MQEHKRKFSSVHRDLIEYIGMIIVKRMSLRNPFDWIGDARIADYCSAYCETALFLNEQWFELAVFGGSRLLILIDSSYKCLGYCST